MAKRSKKGVLRTLRDGGSSKPPRKKKSIGRRIVGWLGGAVVIAFLLLVLVALGGRMFFPGARGRSGEGVFEVVEVVASHGETASGERAVATAYVVVEAQRVPIPLTTDERRGVEVGDRLEIAYTYLPNLGTFRVESWAEAP